MQKIFIFIVKAVGMERKIELPISTIITIVTIIFTAGIAYGQFKSLEEHVVTLEERLDKKVKILNSLEEEIDLLRDELTEEVHTLELEQMRLKTKLEPPNSDH